MNYTIWEINDCVHTFKPLPTVEENYDDMMEWLVKRAAWMDKVIMADDFVQNKLTVEKVASVNVEAADIDKGECHVSFPEAKYTLSNAAAKMTEGAGDYEIAYAPQGSEEWKTVTTQGALEYDLTGLEKEGVYSIKVRAIAEVKGQKAFGDYSDAEQVQMTEAQDPEQAAAPAKAGKLKVSLKPSKKAAVLTLSSVAGAESYQVFYRRGGAGQWKTVSIGKKLKYTIKGLSKGKTYEFRYAGCRQSGDEWLAGEGSAVVRGYMKTVKPALKPGKKLLSVKWSKDTKSSGYQIRYSTKKSMKHAAVKSLKNKKSRYHGVKIRNLTAKKQYYVQVRACKITGKQKYYGPWSETRAAKVR